MSWLCRNNATFKTVYPETVFNEFTNVDPKTKQVKR